MMIRKPLGIQRHSINLEKRLFFVFFLLIMVIIAGTFGYSYIEGWNVLDSFYMTLITVTTIGYGEIHQLSMYGRMFTSVVIVTGVGVMGYFLGTFTQYIVEGEIRRTFGLRKMKKDIKNLSNHYIVCGYGKVGRQVCEELRSRGIETIVIESDPSMAEHALLDGFYAINDDAAADDALNKARILYAKGLVGAVGSDADNVFITLTAKEMNPDIFVVVRAESPSSQKKLRRSGANRVISPDLIGGKKMALAAIRPNIVEFMDIITPDEKTNFTIEEIIVGESSPIAGLTIRESKVRQTAGVIIIGIKKNGDFIFNPLADDRIVGGDILIVVGNEKQLDTMYKICSQVNTMETAVIDLFPLHTVLFPYQVIPLQIFEPRYLNMVSRCFEQSQSFGICLIDEGTEVGPPAIPHKIGTSAQIISLRPITEDKLFVFARGERRFFIRKLLQEQPHIRVEVEWIDPMLPSFPGDYAQLKLCIENLLKKLPQQNLKIPQNENQIFGLVSALLSGLRSEKQDLLQLEADEIVPQMIEILERTMAS